MVLAVLYAVPVVQLSPARPYLDGAVFTVLLGALLWADRVERAYAGAALGVVVAAAALGMAVAPRLAGDGPWIDYERLAEGLTTPRAASFSWEHGYGPLDWPRDGREMLRIRARAGAYWKTADLDAFDGVRWRVGGVPPGGLDSEVPRAHRSWRQRLDVTVRNLRSRQFVTAGVAVSVRRSPRRPVPATPGTFATREPLRRGDTYRVDAYTPRPSPRELARAGTAYPAYTNGPYLEMDLPRVAGGPAIRRPDGVPRAVPFVAQIRFAPFGTGLAPQLVDPRGFATADGDRALARSAYGPVYALALRLRARARTPYAYARAIQAYLARGFAYTEEPVARRLALPAFLRTDRAGYCQHFAGAMALLLRMGGVPARVAAGFSPGTYDAARRDWVVRDRDAHSWVEAYFPGIGWATFDPTPQAAPPRGQLVPPGSAAARGAQPLAPGAARADVPRRPARGAPRPPRATRGGEGRRGRRSPSVCSPPGRRRSPSRAVAAVAEPRRPARSPSSSARCG